MRLRLMLHCWACACAGCEGGCCAETFFTACGGNKSGYRDVRVCSCVMRHVQVCSCITACGGSESDFKACAGVPLRARSCKCMGIASKLERWC